jgi:hypothetical protein
MANQESRERRLFNGANAAAKDAMGSVVELARRTRTSVIICRNGVIERIAPETIALQDVTTEPVPTSNDTKG